MTCRMTHYAHGGGCACKIPPGELEDVVKGLSGAGPESAAGELEDGDAPVIGELVPYDGRTLVER